MESAADVLASPLIHRLRERETDVSRSAAEMATELGPRHPRMVNIKAELDEVRARLGAEVGKIVRGLTNELEVARIGERTLQRNLENLKTEAAQTNTAQGRLRVLEREAAANRDLFDTVLARWKETGRQDEIQDPDARIISYAEVPRAPSSPKKARIVGAAWALSTFLGIVLVFLIEQLDSGFRSSEQIEDMTGSRTLGLIPMLTFLRTGRGSPVDYLSKKPASLVRGVVSHAVHRGPALARRRRAEVDPRHLVAARGRQDDHRGLARTTPRPGGPAGAPRRCGPAGAAGPGSCSVWRRSPGSSSFSGRARTRSLR